MSGQMVPCAPGGITSKLLEMVKKSPKEWVAEEKLNGSQYMLTFDHGAYGNTLCSRRTSVKTGQLCEKSRNLPWLASFEVPHGLNGTVLTGEVYYPGEAVAKVTRIMGSSPARAAELVKELGRPEYRVYDIMKLGGEDVTKLPFAIRRKHLVEVVQEVAIPDMTFTELLDASDPERLFKHITSKARGEGIMLKRLAAGYYDPDFSYKWKVERFFDVVIMGFGESSSADWRARGLVGSVIFGQYVDGVLTQLGSSSGIDFPTRKKMSDNREALIGTVIEIKAQERNPSGAFQHPRFIRFRDDKDATACVWRKDEA